MGDIEKAVRKRARKQNIQNAILTTVAVAGTLAWIMVAPNTLRLLKYTPLARKKSAYRVDNSLQRLIKGGYVTVAYLDGRREITLTLKGHARLLRFTGISAASSKRKKWDRRWRVVIFDIPEKRRNARDRLRETLIQIGFLKLQASAWIYPYDCEDVIMLLKADFSVGKEVLYIVTDNVGNDANFRKHFKLPT